MDKLSYAWGLAMGKQLQAMGVKELNSESLIILSRVSRLISYCYRL